MGRYPDYETYRALYARYHGRGVEDLIRLIEPLEGTRVIDLCGGDGRLTNRLIDTGVRSVLFVDGEPRMVPPAIWQHKEVQVVIEQVQKALTDLMKRGETYDRIVCQQAVNYWLDEETARLLASALNPGGVFAFNTFNQRPSEIPRVLQYELNEHSFVEISWLKEREVHHLQVRDGLEPHYTSFQWLSSKRIKDILNPFFKVTEERKERSSLYRCEKREA